MKFAFNLLLLAITFAFSIAIFEMSIAVTLMFLLAMYIAFLPSPHPNSSAVCGFE